MPNFIGKKNISLQPNDADVPYQFEVVPASSAGANDGFIPAGTNVSSASGTLTKMDAAATDATTEVVQAVTVGSNIVTVDMTYPTVAGEGQYKLTLVLTLDSGTVLEANFNRIFAEDL